MGNTIFFPHAIDGTSDNMRCGVAVSDKPEGPFKYETWIENDETIGSELIFDPGIPEQSEH